MLPAYTYIGREVQKEVVTIHANAQPNRLRQKEVKKSDCHKDQNAENYHQFPQTALPCKTYRGARSPLVVEYMSAKLQACAMHYVEPHTYRVHFMNVK